MSAAGGDANRGTRSRPVAGRGHVVCVERHHAVPSSSSARSAGEYRAAHAGVAARRGGIRDQGSAGVERAVGRELAFEFLVLTATRTGEIRDWVREGLALRVNGRMLLAYPDESYEEWGYSGSLIYEPGAVGRAACACGSDSGSAVPCSGIPATPPPEAFRPQAQLRSVARCRPGNQSNERRNPTVEGRPGLARGHPLPGDPVAAFPGALVSGTEAHGRRPSTRRLLSSLPSSARRTASEAYRSTRGWEVWPPDPPAFLGTFSASPFDVRRVPGEPILEAA